MTVFLLAPEWQPGPGPLKSGIKPAKRHLNWESKAEIVITITWDANYNALTKGRITVREMVVTDPISTLRYLFLHT